MANEVFVFSPGPVLDALEEIAADAGEDSLEDLGDELLPRLVDAGRAREHRFDDYWRDVGTVDAYWESHQELVGDDPPIDLDDPAWPVLTQASSHRAPAHTLAGAEVGASLLAPAARVAGTVERSVIGRGAVVEAGAVVRESVVLPGAVVRAGATVERAILDDRVEIGRGAAVGEAGGKVALVGLRAQVEADGRIPAGARHPDVETTDSGGLSRAQHDGVAVDAVGALPGGLVLDRHRRLQGALDRREAEAVRLGRRRRVADVEVGDEHAAGPEEALDLREHRAGVVDVVERVAHHDDVDGGGEQRDALGADGEVDGRRAVDQEAVRRVALVERIDREAHARRARVGEAERARADVEHDLAVEEGGVVDGGLAEHPHDLRAGDLPAAPLVGVGHRLVAEQLRHVARVEAARADHGIPLGQPPAQLVVALDRAAATQPPEQ